MPTDKKNLNLNPNIVVLRSWIIPQDYNQLQQRFCCVLLSKNARILSYFLFKSHI